MDKLIEQTLVRYISPLREGGSLPALGEADDLDSAFGRLYAALVL